MTEIVKYPSLLFVVSFGALGLAVLLGDFFRKRRPMEDGGKEDYGLVESSTLTLLGLLIGFTFSMALSRFDQRKNYEEEEANAIGTEYVRADLLLAPDAARVRELLKQYLSQRILFYTARNARQLRQIDASTAQLQSEMWSIVQARGTIQTHSVAALAVSGMNDVLNSQGYTQAAWWNTIPVAAWTLLMVIAVGSSFLIGYGAHRTSIFVFMILPLVVSISFFLIADIDSPRRGMIRVSPINLLSLAQSLTPH